jgi:hypothetical protein
MMLSEGKTYSDKGIFCNRSLHTFFAIQQNLYARKTKGLISLLCKDFILGNVQIW